MPGYSSDWQVPCPGTPNKRKYRTREFCQQVADRVWEEKRVRLSVYACADCGWFHLTRRTNGSDVVQGNEPGTHASKWNREHPGEQYRWDR